MKMNIGIRNSFEKSIIMIIFFKLFEELFLSDFFVFKALLAFYLNKLKPDYIVSTRVSLLALSNSAIYK